MILIISGLSAEEHDKVTVRKGAHIVNSRNPEETSQQNWKRRKKPKDPKKLPGKVSSVTLQNTPCHTNQQNKKVTGGLRQANLDQG